MLEKDLKELQLIEKKISKYESNKEELENAIKTIDTDIVALEHSTSLIIATASVDKLREVKKLKDKLQSLREDRGQVLEMLQVLESNFKAELKADLRELLKEKNGRRIAEFRQYQEEQRAEFEKAIAKQWSIYRELESTSNEYKQFNKHLLSLWDGYELEEDKQISNICRYDSNFQDGITSLYHYSEELFKAKLPSAAVIRKYFD